MVHLCESLEGHVAETKKLPLVLQVAIFLDWIAYASTLRQQKKTYHVSHKLILRARRQITQAVMAVIYPQYVKQPSTIPDLTGNHRTRNFQGAFGCVDGSHIPIQVPHDEQEKWRNRKLFTSTNAVATCTVDGSLLFTFALFGAEGRGPDSSVLDMATSQIRWLPNGFLLADAGYGLRYHRTLTPYRGERYHLNEFSNSAQGRPQNPRELFNLRHASAR